MPSPGRVSFISWMNRIRNCSIDSLVAALWGKALKVAKEWGEYPHYHFPLRRWGNDQKWRECVCLVSPSSCFQFWSCKPSKLWLIFEFRFQHQFHLWRFVIWLQNGESVFLPEWFCAKSDGYSSPALRPGELSNFLCVFKVGQLVSRAIPTPPLRLGVRPNLRDGIIWMVSFCSELLQSNLVERSKLGLVRVIFPQRSLRLLILSPTIWGLELKHGERAAALDEFLSSNFLLASSVWLQIIQLACSLYLQVYGDNIGSWN